MCDVLVAEVGRGACVHRWHSWGREVSAAPSALASEGPSLAREGQAQGPRQRGPLARQRGSSSRPSLVKLHASEAPALAGEEAHARASVTPAARALVRSPATTGRQRERVHFLMKLINSVRRSPVPGWCWSEVQVVRRRRQSSSRLSGRIQAPPGHRTARPAHPWRAHRTGLGTSVRRTPVAVGGRRGAKRHQSITSIQPRGTSPCTLVLPFRDSKSPSLGSARSHVRTRYTHSPCRVQSDHKQPCTYVHATRVAIHAHPGRHELAPLSTTPFSPTRHTPHPSTHTRGFGFVTLPVFFVSAQGVSKESFHHRAATTRRPMLTSRTGSRPCA